MGIAVYTVYLREDERADGKKVEVHVGCLTMPDMQELQVARSKVVFRLEMEIGANDINLVRELLEAAKAEARARSIGRVTNLDERETTRLHRKPL